MWEHKPFQTIYTNGTAQAFYQISYYKKKPCITSMQFFCLFVFYSQNIGVCFMLIFNFKKFCYKYHHQNDIFRSQLQMVKASCFTQLHFSEEVSIKNISFKGKHLFLQIKFLRSFSGIQKCGFQLSSKDTIYI